MSTLATEAEPVEVYVDGRKKRFVGRRVGCIVQGATTVTVFVTKGESLAVHDDHDDGELRVYDDFEEFKDEFEVGLPDLVAQVAQTLGEEYVEELDI